MFSNLKDFTYQLPENLITNQSVSPRDYCRLMVLDRKDGQVEHHYFYDLLDLLNQEDVLVLNQSKVFPARLLGKKGTGGKVEILLLRQINLSAWQAISRPGVKKGTEIIFEKELRGLIKHQDVKNGEIEVEFNLSGSDFWQTLNQIGQTPIPPYIHSDLTEQKLRHQYQTVYAKQTGSAAAPTAGMHFTKKLLDQLEGKGIQIEYITLHVGLGTFQNLREENIKTNTLHHEYFEISQPVASRVNHAKKQGKRIIAVGTTTVRALESSLTLINGNYQLNAGSRETNIFIHPPFKFNFIDSLITNFHLPQSSLLMLVSAFVSQPNSKSQFKNFQNSIIGEAYREAINNKYRFFSFGDAMFIV